MDEFKLEDDLISETREDRRPERFRRPAAKTGVAISRQYVMIGVGVLILLLLVIGLGSALNAPTEHEAEQRNPNLAAKNINITDAFSLNNINDQKIGVTGNTHHNAEETKNIISPQEVRVPQIYQAPVEKVAESVNNDQLRRVELPGSITTALSQKQDQIDSVSQEMIDITEVPSSEALESSKKSRPDFDKDPAPESEAIHTQSKQPKAKTPIVTNKLTSKVDNKTELATGGNSLQNMPSSHFTLQLSSASRFDTLEAFAKQQSLTDYQIYETRRDGKPWFVLVSGNYASSMEAKKAIAALPADVRAKKPWAKSVHQIQQHLIK